MYLKLQVNGTKYKFIDDTLIFKMKSLKVSTCFVIDVSGKEFKEKMEPSGFNGNMNTIFYRKNNVHHFGGTLIIED